MPSPVRQSVVKAGAAVLGALSTAGLTALVGEPVSSSLAGAAFGAVLDELGSRAVGAFERRRQVTAATAAAHRIKALFDAGEQVRADGFFDETPTGRSMFEELAEGVMLAAQREHEERKVPYLGNLIANLAFSSSVDKATANWALRAAGEASWTQYLLLAMVGRADRRFPDDMIVGNHTGTWTSWSIHRGLEDLAADGHKLIVGVQKGPQKTYPRFKWRANEMDLTPGGEILYGLMSLSDVPDSDLDNVLLQAETAPDQSGAGA